MEEKPKGEPLKFKPDMTLAVLTSDNQLNFLAKVDRFTNGTLTIRESTGRELSPVLYNQEIKMRFFQGQKTILVQGHICGSTRWIWKLDRLENMTVEEKRAFFRQHVNLPARASCTKRSSDSPSGNPGSGSGPCRVMDISASGISIRSKEAYYVGDILSITDACLVPEEPPFTFECQVRRVQEVKGGTQYGCHFQSQSDKDQDRLLRAIFIAQRKDIQTQRDRG